MNNPTAASTKYIDDGRDTGASDTDNVTAHNTPTFDLVVPSGCSFRVYRDGIQISGDFETGSSYTTAVQADGTYHYTVAAVDAAGNVSEQSPPLAVTIDAQPPAVKNVLVGGTDWTGEFLAGLEGIGNDRKLRRMFGLSWQRQGGQQSRPPYR